MDDGPAPERDRRAARRFDTTGQLPGQVAVDLEADVLVISLGGMTLETRMPLAVNTRHEFILTISGEELGVYGVVRDCCPQPAFEKPLSYRVGIDFLRLSARQRDLLKSLVED